MFTADIRPVLSSQQLFTAQINVVQISDLLVVAQIKYSIPEGERPTHAPINRKYRREIYVAKA